MMQIRIVRIRADRVDRLEEWMAELGRRVDEVRETLVREGITHEMAYLVHTGDGPLLVYATESADHERAQRVFAESDLPIDREHKAALTEVVDGLHDATLLLDVSQTPAD